MNKLTTTIVGFAFLVSIGTSYAATDTDTFQVTATVAAQCTISAANLAFGNYDPFSATLLDSTSAITVKCTNDADYDVSLNGGSSGDVNARTMEKGNDTLNYQLYQDAARTTVWGDTVGTDTVNGTGTGLDQTLAVYGRVPAGQNSPAGNYTDTITATITF